MTSDSGKCPLLWETLEVVGGGCRSTESGSKAAWCSHPHRPFSLKSWSRVYRLMVKLFQGWVGNAWSRTGDAGMGSGAWELRLLPTYRGMQLRPSKRLPDLQVSQQNLGNTYNVQCLDLRCLQPCFNVKFFV